MLEFAAWLTRRRERVCLAQRVDSGPRLVGLVSRTIRNMLTELFAHAWPRRYAAWRSLSKQERAVYENEVLEPIAGLHKLGSQVTDDAEDMDGGWGRTGTNERTTTCSLDNSARSR